MPMPVILDAEWIPLMRYSNFEFGSPVDRYVSSAWAGLRQDPPSAKSFFSDNARAIYRTDDLDCDVETINGLVHRITAREACVFGGFNLIGSKLSAVLNLISGAPVSWHVPWPDEPRERVGVVPSLGLELLVMYPTQSVVQVTLRASLSEHLERERSARRCHGGLIDALWPTYDPQVHLIVISSIDLPNG